MKRKAVKEPKEDKPQVELRDLTSIKDSKGQLRRGGGEIPGRIEPVRRPGLPWSDIAARF